jgi:hypothetical protein
MTQQLVIPSAVFCARDLLFPVLFIPQFFLHCFFRHSSKSRFLASLGMTAAIDLESAADEHFPRD